ncbi:MAG: hypothetical protein ACYDG6_04250 [Thermincolia bacterium]
MFRQSWYKFLTWAVAAFFFLVMAGTVAGIFGAGPSQSQAMLWKQGMMTAMHVSIMGWAMENQRALIGALAKTQVLVFPAIFTGAVLGAVIRMRRAKDE